MPDKWSFFENGMPGLHLTLNPQKPLPAEARIYRQYVGHNMTLSYRELQALMAGRSQGIATINRLVDKLLPGFAPDKRLNLSTRIADALLDKSLSAQLSREAPNVLDGLQQTEDKLNQLYRRGPPPSVLQQTPVGISVTIHF